MDTDNLMPGPAETPSSAQGESQPMNSGPNGSAANNSDAQQPGGGGRRNRRRRRGRRNGRPSQGAGPAQGQERPHNRPPQHAHGRHQRRAPHGGGGGGAPQGHGAGSVFTAPMDHSYRQQAGNGEVNGNSIHYSGGGGRNQRRFGRGGFRQNAGDSRAGMPPAALGAHTVEPLPTRADDGIHIFGFVEDLFFVTKINETARKLNVRVEFVKTVEELLEKAAGEKPSLVMVDLNSGGLKPLTVIPKLRAEFKKGTSVLGFVSHVQGDLKIKAQEAGCDTVMPRSAFSQTLPQLLRRHGAPEELLEE